MGVGSFDRASQTVLWIEKFKIQNSNLAVITVKTVKVRGNLRWNLVIGYKVYGPTERPSCAAHVDGLVQV